MKKWLGDLAIVQKEVGVVPWICPSNNFIYDRTSTFWAEIYDQCDALWGDAATLVPWAVYQSSGDVSVLEQQYESMKSWVNTEKRLADIVEEDSPRYIWKHGMQLGDWLAPGKDMHGWTASAKWTSTAYFANSAHIVSQAAAILGKTEDAAAYDALFQTICQAFRDNFVEPDGHITDGFQSIYALALRFGLLLPEHARALYRIFWMTSKPATIIWEPALSEPQNFLLHFPMKAKHRKPTICCSRIPARPGSIRSAVALLLPGSGGILCAQTEPSTTPMTARKIWFPLTTMPTVLSVTGCTPASAAFPWQSRATRHSVLLL